LLRSLYPDQNLSLKTKYATGGRSDSDLIFTYDKKYIIKTISLKEFKSLIYLLEELSIKYKSGKTLFCKIYMCIQITFEQGRQEIIIVMKNMNDFLDVKMFLLRKICY
jgi:hypothetical protein